MVGKNDVVKLSQMRAPALVEHAARGVREHEEVIDELWRRLKLQAGRVALRANEEAKP